MEMAAEGEANEPRPAAKCPWQRSDQANGTFCKRACQTLLEDWDDESQEDFCDTAQNPILNVGFVSTSKIKCWNRFTDRDVEVENSIRYFMYPVLDRVLLNTR